MRNIFQLIKTASQVSMNDINSAVEQYLVSQYLPVPQTGRSVVDGKHQPFDQDWRAIDDGRIYRNGLQYDPTPVNQYQVKLLKDYKIKKKQFIKQLKPGNSKHGKFVQQKFYVLNILKNYDPTTSNDNPIGSYSDLILNLYKNKQLSRQGGNLTGDRLQSQIYSINEMYKILKHYNVPVKPLNKIQSSFQLGSLHQYYQENFASINIMQNTISSIINHYKLNDKTNVKSWLINITFKQNVDLSQDYTSVTKNIKQFFHFVKQGKIKINKSLQDNTYQQLSSTVQKLNGSLPQAQPSEEGAKIIQSLTPIIQSGPYKLFSSTNFNVIQQIGCNTTWCTRKQMGQNSRAQTYVHYDNGMYFVTKDDKVILQMLPTLSQFMDINNQDVLSKIFKLSDQDLKTVLIPYFKRVIAQSGFRNSINKQKIDYAMEFLNYKNQKVSQQDYFNMLKDCISLGNIHTSSQIFAKHINVYKTQAATLIMGAMIANGDASFAQQFANKNNIDKSVMHGLNKQLQNYIIKSINESNGIQAITYKILKTVNCMHRLNIEISNATKQKISQIATKQAMFALRPDQYAFTQFYQAVSLMKLANIDISNIVNLLKKQAQEVVNNGTHKILMSGDVVEDPYRVNNFTNFLQSMKSFFDFHGGIKPQMQQVINYFNKMMSEKQLQKSKQPVSACNWFTKIT